ncbi:MAG: hypothetical protein U1E65_21455 [Myxococcota bacterium]
MRLPTIVRAKDTLSQFAFRPTRRIEIFHRAADRAQQGPRRVAVVLTDGLRGKIEACDPRFEPVITRFFSAPRYLLGPGSPRRLAPWKLESTAPAALASLGQFDLRAEVGQP